VTVGVISLGCPKNLVDTEVMLGLLRQAGFSVVTDPERAEALIVNTCCFIAAARQESADALTEAVALRRAGKTKALICAGCWPEGDAAAIRARFPEIDALMGPGDVANIVAIIKQALAGQGPAGPLSPPVYLYDDTTPRLQATPRWTAYLKVAEGCDHRCRFCTIPRLRGRYRSRTRESVLREAHSLVSSGVHEIILIAQDTTAYGLDLDGPDIGDLLTELAALPGLHWIRLLYTFPSRITSRLIEVMAKEPVICKYIDVPFQHADPEVLRRMGRPGNGDTYLELITHLRSAMPDVAIRSTFLVGFPGESEEAFRRLLHFLEAAQLDRAGAFVYSLEPGTHAAQMPGQVAGEVAQARYHELMVRQQAISLERNRAWLNREIEVLVESRSRPRGPWIGRSFRDAPDIDGSVILKAGPHRLQLGRFVRARVTKAQPYDLVAHL